MDERDWFRRIVLPRPETPGTIGVALDFVARGTESFSAANSSTGPARSILPNYGLRDSIFSFAPEVRAAILSAADSQLEALYPGLNVTAEEAARVALGGWHVYLHTKVKSNSGAAKIVSASGWETSAEVFKSRFPQSADAIERLANRQYFSAMAHVGPAIGEIRWMGPAALSESITAFGEDDVLRVSKESLDPTGSLPSIAGPLAIDWIFAALVFYSTLWVLVASEDGGVRYYVSKLLGSRLTDALIDPVNRSLVMNAQLLICRMTLSQLVSLLLLPEKRVLSIAWPMAHEQPHFLTAVSPLLAFVTTWAPAVPPILTMALPVSLLSFILYGSSIRSIGVFLAYAWYIFTVEPTILEAGVGTDGIPVLDAFSIWMGWFVFGAPVGLVLGPWAFVSLRQVYREVVRLVAEKSQSSATSTVAVDSPVVQLT
ncbi:hypothetical protein DFJ73DRAFT_164928 [Zopfochytrium polystomum]|nr:hypothetical protein DFJ73DRAFT_164928 [Zopfochytrium polystomum]